MAPRSTPRRRRPIEWATTLTVGLLVLTACAEIPDPELGAEITVRPGGFDSEQTPDDTSPGEAATVDEPAAVLPPRDPNYVPTLIAGGPSGISQGTIDGLEPLGAAPGDIPVVDVVDDLFGGLVIEDVDGSVFWFPAEGTEPTLVAGPGARLLDIGYLDNTAEALVLIDGTSVERIRLVDGEASSLVSLPDTETLGDFSAAGGLYALAIADEACGVVRFVNSGGDEVSIAGPPLVPCPVPRRTTYPTVAISPDGDALAYTEVTYRSDGVEAETTLVGRELSSSVELFRLPVGAAGERVTSLGFDGHRVVFLRTGLSGENSLVLMDAVGEGIPPEQLIAFPADGPTSVAFARVPLTVGLGEPVAEG